VRAEDDGFGSILDYVFNGWKGRDDAGIVGDLAGRLVLWDVEVHPDQHPLPFDLSRWKIGDSFLRR
jgi:hypothetical protein